MNQPMEMVDVYAGTVIWYSEDRGYGFIKCDGARPGDRGVFIHRNFLATCDIPKAGDRVMFEIEWERDRWSALNLEPLRLP